MSKYLTRKEIAGIIDSSVMHIVRSEDRLGLTPHKILYGKRQVRYRRAGVEKVLREQGYIV